MERLIFRLNRRITAMANNFGCELTHAEWLLLCLERLNEKQNMTTDQLKALRDAIDAHLRGDPVQYSDGKGWYEAANATFCERFMWRPKPKEPLRFWAIVTGYPGDVGRTYTHLKYAIADCPSIGRVVEFVEVMRDEKPVVKIGPDEAD
jgi:hypothetical protein